MTSYLDTSAMLASRHAGVDSFRSVHSECQEAVARLEDALKHRLADKDVRRMANELVLVKEIIFYSFRMYNKNIIF